MILAMDLGSTNFKVALFSTLLERIGEAAVPTPYSHNDGERIEMDADAVRASAADLIMEICGDAGVATAAIASVAITSQAQNCVVLDGAGGARTHVMSWLDRRAVAEARELWESVGRDWHRHCSFAPLTGAMQLAHLRWMRRHVPDVFEGEFSIVTLPALVFQILSGLNLTDDNLAAMGGRYSLQTGGWREDLEEICGVPPDAMPRVVRTGVAVTAPTQCTRLDLAAELRLVSAGNDQTAGAFGNGCREGDVVVALGTALVAYRHAGNAPGPYSDAGCWGPFPGGGHYELACIDEGCLALDWAREELMPGSSIEAFDDAVAAAIPGITERTGSFDPKRIRTPHAWQGQFRDVSEKAYAVLERIAFELRHLVYDVLGCGAITTLRAIGGGSHSEVWLQIIADVLGCSVTVGTGDSLLGAAAMAAGQPPGLPDAKRFEPDPMRSRLMQQRRNGHHVAVSSSSVQGAAIRLRFSACRPKARTLPSSFQRGA